MLPAPPRRLATRLRRPAVAGALASAVLVLTGCAPDAPHRPEPHPTGKPSTEFRAPQANASFDYQLGGPYPPPAGVTVLARDRTASPEPGHYNICYVNAFQTQPGRAVDRWDGDHPDLLLRDDSGDPVIDEDWQEALLDISTASKRQRLLDIVGRWIDGCAESGFDAIEPDNLDSYERSDGLLTKNDAAAFARLLADRAHARGLAVGQKNTTDLLPRRARIGFDFAVVEECARYDECDRFADTYDDRILDIEYSPPDYDQACRTWGTALSITLRDRDVTPAGSAGHVHRHC
ncbi:hypothetical protein DSC45_20295 [Streptomyces sp. YIM 130001]|uniref:endo alpha-1,4 polygalactosaminidase n=1 Tax=Streptomyces sp. YIM 130001 TaxID=2259644 RepID=UPI000ED80BC5|nr:endo alpha-1,4 polygalactosaminidase [Streptomyces sp. YIM 130001]RII14696.1 hypothetical protein DSC45_20295 [Streptomyces sp. YIM 130001]